MEIKEIENALNELINKATESGGFVWIVDGKQNNFAVRLKAPIKLSALIMEDDNGNKGNGN
jgi:hypothetical protein